MPGRKSQKNQEDIDRRGVRTGTGYIKSACAGRSSCSRLIAKTRQDNAAPAAVLSPQPLVVFLTPWPHERLWKGDLRCIGIGKLSLRGAQNC
eukprot:scaffold17888_cov149-Isochrysis_galbana.AAC.6